MKTKEEFVEWCDKHNIILELTRTQYLFLEFLLAHQVELESIGDLERVFTITRKFIKDDENRQVHTQRKVSKGT
jgi:hypothetical protein